MPHIQQDNENGRKADEDAMEVIDRYHLDSLKRKKTQAKAACTRTRKLMALMDSDRPSRRQIRQVLQQIDDAQQVALEIIRKIADEYKSCNDLQNVQKVNGKMEDVTERAQAYLNTRIDEP